MSNPKTFFESEIPYKEKGADSKINFWQGYYPSEDNFIDSLLIHIQSHDLNLKSIESDYDNSELKDLLVNNKYTRFIKGMSNNGSQVNFRYWSSMIRTPLAYAFIAHPEEVSEFMKEWHEQSHDDVLPIYQENPIRRYRQNRSNSLHLTEQPMHPAKSFSKMNDDQTERRLNLLFGADQELLDLSEQYRSPRKNALPIAVYLADRKYNSATLRGAVPIIANYLNDADDLKLDPKPKDSYNLSHASLRLNALTSKSGYQKIIDLIGDRAGDNSLAWAILSEKLKLSIYQTQEYAHLDPVQIMEKIAIGIELPVAIRLVENDIDNFLAIAL